MIAVAAPTPASFRRRAEAAARAANPDAPDLTFTWVHGPERVTWADGTAGLSGVVTLSASGFRTRNMHASWLEGHGLTVR